MALQLMKLFVDAQTTTSVSPDVTRYFYVTTADVAPGSSLTIDAADFFADDGSAVTELPALVTDSSYFNAYVNGILQMEGLSTYTPGITAVGSLVIDVPADSDPILAQSPVVLEVSIYSATSDTAVTT